MQPTASHHSPLFDELRAIQREHGYLPADRLRALADRLALPLYRLQSVVSFYPHFHLTPPARARVRVCGDMSCHLQGAPDLRAAIAARLRGLGPAEASVDHVSCLGRCDGAPAVDINDRIFDRATAGEVDALVRGVLAGRPLPPASATGPAVRLASDPYAEGGERYGVVRGLVRTRDWDGVIATLKASGLRGLGGAGFPTGLKWEIVRGQPGPDKYIVCNADESEPGTIKDRFIMQHAPHLLVEGMIVGGLVAGARHGIVYIRHEYEAQEHLLAAEIRACYEAGLLGPGLLGSDLSFDLEIFVSPGGYICGEESALLEAIEGKRAEPRNKPPFPGQKGLWQKPTVINNVETLAFVPVILARGGDWVKAQGRDGSAGLKFVGVSGDVVKPGVFEVPMGTPYAELIHDYAGGLPPGRTLKAFAPSGPAAGFLPAAMADLPLDWAAVAAAGSMVGSGALVVCADHRCMLDLALNATTFFRNESCGKCVPCRVGSEKLVSLLTDWSRGVRGPADEALIDDLSAALRLTSICGLGQVVPVPVAFVLRYFREEVDEHLLRRRCPADVCFRAPQATA